MPEKHSFIDNAPMYIVSWLKKNHSYAQIISLCMLEINGFDGLIGFKGTSEQQLGLCLSLRKNQGGQFF